MSNKNEDWRPDAFKRREIMRDLTRMSNEFTKQLDRRDLAAEAADRLVGNPDAIWVEVYDVITDPRLGHAEKLDMAKCLLTTAHSVILTLRRHIRDGARS